MLKNIMAMFFIAVILPYHSFAAAPVNALLQQWNDARLKQGNETDTANVSLLNKLSENYRYNHADSALHFAKQALAIAQKTKYTTGEAAALFNIGMSNYVIGSYFPALDAVSKLMALSNKHNYKPGIANSYQLRGLIYLLQDEFDFAITEFSKAYKVFAQLDNKNKMARMLFDIGLCYDERHQPKKAFLYLDKAMSVAKSVNDEHVISMIWNRKAETYYHTKNYKAAIALHNQVLNAAYQDNWENGFALSGLAQSQYALGKYAEAISNATKSFEISRKVNSTWDAARALKVLNLAYAAIGDYKQAYTYQSLMNKYNETYMSDIKQKTINYLQLKQQRSENLRLERENDVHREKTDFNKLLLVGSIILTICISVFAVVISRSNVQQSTLNKKLARRNKSIALQKEEIIKQNKKLDQLNHTKNQLFSVVSHDLRSPFATLLQTMDLIRSGDLNKEEQDEIMETSYQQLSTVAVMVNNLLMWANSQQGGIKSEAEVLDITLTINEILLVSEHIAANKNIKLIHNDGQEQPAFADADHVKIIMQNLVGNAIKFTPTSGSITISYSENENYRVIHIQDTGTGIAAEKMEKLFKVVGKQISGYGTNKEPGAGIGLLLIKQFVDVNHGRLEIKSDYGKGTEVLVYLPKTAIDQPIAEIV